MTEMNMQQLSEQGVRNEPQRYFSNISGNRAANLGSLVDSASVEVCSVCSLAGFASIAFVGIRSRRVSGLARYAESH